MDTRDICLSRIPNVHNFQHEFSNQMISKFAKQGYVVENCYLNDNLKQYTFAFIRLSDPSLHRQAINHFSRIGLEVEVEGREYPLNLGWGSSKKDLVQVVEDLSEQLAQQAIIIQEQKVELEKLRSERKDDDKKSNINSETSSIPPSIQDVFQIRAIKHNVEKVHERLTEHSVKLGELESKVLEDSQNDDDDLKNYVAVLDERVTTVEEALVLSQQIKRRAVENADGFAQAGLSRIAVDKNPRASNKEKAERLKIDPEADKPGHVCFICHESTIEICQAFLRNCSECNGVICNGCERELILINTKGDGKIKCAHCRSKNSRFPKLRAFLEAHAKK